MTVKNELQQSQEKKATRSGIKQSLFVLFSLFLMSIVSLVVVIERSDAKVAKLSSTQAKKERVNLLVAD